MPKISVLVPTYNYANFLEESLLSILSQDRTDFELVISDDASTDNSAEIIRSYAAADSRVRAYIQPRNIGMVQNWNWCLSRARGDYIKYVFGDDRLASTTSLRRYADLLESDKSVVMAASARVILNDRSQVIDIWDELRSSLYKGPHLIAECLRLSRNLIGEPTCVMFKKSAMRRGFDCRYRQIVDLEMWLHLLQSGNLAYTEELLADFRKHDRQQTAKNRHGKVGSQESVRLLYEYINYWNKLESPGRGRFKIRASIWRSLYYSKKDCVGNPEFGAIYARLKTHLSRGWICLLWLRHKILTPYGNVKNAFSKYVLRQKKQNAKPALSFTPELIIHLPGSGIRSNGSPAKSLESGMWRQKAEVTKAGQPYRMPWKPGGTR